MAEPIRSSTTLVPPSFNDLYAIKHKSVIDDLQTQIRDYVRKNGGKEEERLLELALTDIRRYHATQERSSGEPVIIHPLRVSSYVCQAGLDSRTVIAALLHDIIEDTAVRKADIAAWYGPWYAEIVDGLTKIKNPTILGKKRTTNFQATYQKMLLAMLKDPRSLCIKLFDRLDNMRDMGAVSQSKKRRVSLETMQVYVPMAQRLGMKMLAREHIELCFQYLYQRRYKKTLKHLSLLKEQSLEHIQFIESSVTELLQSHGIQCKVKPVYTHPSEHIETPHPEKIDKFLDGFRILVPEKLTCYVALGILHTHYTAVPQQVRDFISNLRWDGYQGLQTIIVVEGEQFLFKIITQEMEDLNLFGIIAHFKGEHSKPLTEYYRNYFEQLDQIAGEEDLRIVDVLSHTQSDQVQVFTPKGEMRCFPQGATILDFAYYIHTDLGNHCIGALVHTSPLIQKTYSSRSRVSRRRKLCNGESITILTDSTIQPSRDWLTQSLTPRSQIQIRYALKQQTLDRAISLGKQRFSEELQVLGIGQEQWSGEEREEEFMHALEEENLTERQFFRELGLGKRTARAFLREHELIDYKAQALGGRFLMLRSRFPFREDNKITISDMKDPLFRFSECCAPIPGDKIIGFSERNEVVIHQAQCQAIQVPKSKWIQVVWDMPKEELQRHHLRLQILDQKGALYQITKIINDSGTSIEHMDTGHRNSERRIISIRLSPITWKVYHKIVEGIRGLKLIKQFL